MSDQNSNDLWRDIDAHIRSVVDQMLRTPTGVTPGVYNGITLDRYGRATLARSGTVLARYRQTSSQFISPGNIDTVQFNTMVYDPSGLVVTGSSWHYTSGIGGWTGVTILIPIQEGSTGNLYGAGDYMHAYVYVNGSQASAAGPGMIATIQWGTATTGADSYYFLQATEFYLLSPGDTLTIKAENGTNFTRLLGNIAGTSASNAAYITIWQ